MSEDRPAIAEPASVFDLVRVAWDRRALLAVATLVSALAGVAVALLTRPVYRAEILLVPVQDNAGLGGLAGLAGQFGGLASLAGLSLPQDQIRTEAVATLRSRALAQEFIDARSLMPVLFERKWDPDKAAWRGSAAARPPTMGDALLLFDKSIREVREDSKTGLVTLRIDWHDRELAAAWANELVERTNERLRAQAIAEADQSIAYLNRELAKTQNVELSAAINRLIESQIKRKTLAAVQPQFAFKVVDPAIVADADKRVRPKRKLIVVAFALAGLLLGVLLAFWQEYTRSFVAVSPPIRPNDHAT